MNTPGTLKKHKIRGQMEDPIVKLIVRIPSRAGHGNPPGNLCSFETRQIPAVGDEFSLGHGPLYEVQARCCCPLGDDGERPWAVYLEVEEKQ